MNLRRIKHTLLRMTTEEKIVGISALTIIFSVFMPWYSVIMNFDKKSMTETGFSGDLGVIGFVIFLMAIITIIVLIAENMRLPLPQFGYKREQILFFFLGQSFFLALITMAIYTKRGLEFTDANLRFGIYTVMIAAFFGAMSGFALIQKTKQKEVEDFFSDEPQNNTIDNPPKESFNSGEATENSTTKKHDPEPMFFEEDYKPIPDSSLEIENDIINLPNTSQESYFKRDAGINTATNNTSVESRHEAEKKAKTDRSNLGINLYEDQ